MREREQAKHNAESKFIDFMMDYLLDGPVPEREKAPLRVAKALKTTEDYLHDTFRDYFDPETPKSDELLSLQYEVIEYLQLVHAGLKTFVEAHPAPYKKKLTEKEFFYVSERSRQGTDRRSPPVLL